MNEVSKKPTHTFFSNCSFILRGIFIIFFFRFRLKYLSNIFKTVEYFAQNGQASMKVKLMLHNNIGMLPFTELFFLIKK